MRGSATASRDTKPAEVRTISGPPGSTGAARTASPFWRCPRQLTSPRWGIGTLEAMPVGHGLTEPGHLKRHVRRT
jgi:hypothetical protein